MPTRLPGLRRDSALHRQEPSWRDLLAEELRLERQEIDHTTKGEPIGGFNYITPTNEPDDPAHN